MKFSFISKMSQNYKSRCLVEIKVLIQQGKGAVALAHYCSGKACTYTSIIYPPIYQSDDPSTYTPNHWSDHPSIHPSIIRKSIHPSVKWSIQQMIHPPSHYQMIYLANDSSIKRFIHPPVIKWSIQQMIYPSNNSSVSWSIHLLVFRL